MPYFQYRTSFHLQETVILITSVISDIYLDGIEEQNSSVSGRSQDGGAGRGPSKAGDRSVQQEGEGRTLRGGDGHQQQPQVLASGGQDVVVVW